MPIVDATAALVGIVSADDILDPTRRGIKEDGMKLTLSVIKADIGSIGGHIAPSERLMQTVRELVDRSRGSLILDGYVSHTGDDIAILMTHRRGVGDADIHELAWNAFVAGMQRLRSRGFMEPGRICSRMRFPAMSEAWDRR